MTFLGWVTIFGFAVILTALALPLARYMAAVYTGERTWLDPVFACAGATAVPGHAGRPEAMVRTGRRTPRA